jgi:chloramphenicol 3-O-phosphotransferase
MLLNNGGITVSKTSPASSMQEACGRAKLCLHLKLQTYSRRLEATQHDVINGFGTPRGMSVRVAQL